MLERSCEFGESERGRHELHMRVGDDRHACARDVPAEEGERLLVGQDDGGGAAEGAPLAEAREGGAQSLGQAGAREGAVDLRDEGDAKPLIARVTSAPSLTPWIAV